MEEDIRREWRNTRFVRNDAALREVLAGRRTTALTRLANRYRFFVAIEVMMMVVMPFTLIRILSLKVAYIIVYEIILLVCALLDLGLWYRIRCIDCLTMSVREVVRRTLACRRLHIGSVCVLLPCALVLVVFMVMCMPYHAALGAIVGGCVGLAVGFKQLFEFLADYREVASPEDAGDED